MANWACPPSVTNKRNTLRAVVKRSLRIGSLMAAKSLACFSIKTRLALDPATECNKATNSFCSAFIGAVKAAQASFLPSNTAALASWSIASNSVSVANWLSTNQRRI